MNFREWALIAFTLLMQASVGIVVVLAALPLVGGRQTTPPASRMALPVVVAGVAAALGIVASLLHLGQPTQAWLAIANVRSSWLSREIGLALVFVGAGLLFARAHNHAAPPIVRALATATAVVSGLALVYVMSRLYMIAGQPAWDRLTTPVGFFATTVLLGLVVIVTLAAPPLGLRTARVLGVAAVTVLTFQVLLVPALLASVVGEPSAAISAASIGGAAVWLAVGRILLAVVAAVLLVSLLKNGLLIPAGSHARLWVLALVVGSEIFGRVLFYATAVRL